MYVNLGSMTRITKNQARTVMQGLTSAARDFNGMRVLWVVDEDDINVMPKHLPSFVKVAIRLRGVSDHYYTNHEEVALTVSHCGLTAAQASLVNSKPVVCIPFFGDQFDVAVRVRESGAGVVVRREGEHIVEGPQVYEAVTKVLEDLESFQRAAYAVSRRLLDAGGSLEALKLLDIVRRMQGEKGPRGMGSGRTKYDGAQKKQRNVLTPPPQITTTHEPLPKKGKLNPSAGTCFTTSTLMGSSSR